MKRPGRRRGSPLLSAAVAACSLALASVLVEHCPVAFLSSGPGVRRSARVGRPGPGAFPPAPQRCAAGPAGRVCRVVRSAKGKPPAEPRNWQKGFDKAFLDPDASFFERVQGIQALVFDVGGIAISTRDAIAILMQKGIREGHPEAIDALFANGTQARSDIEGLADFARQGPGVLQRWPRLPNRMVKAPQQPPDLNRIRDVVQKWLSPDGISYAMDSAVDGLRGKSRRVREPKYEAVDRRPGFEIRLYEAFPAAMCRSPQPLQEFADGDDDAALRAVEPCNILLGYYVGDGASAFDGATLPMEQRYGFNLTHLRPLTTSFMAPAASQPQAEADLDDAQDTARWPGSHSSSGDPQVSVVRMPERVFAVQKFSGIATVAEVQRQYRLLITALADAGSIYEPQTPGIFSVFQFNPPHTLPWRRRNEVAVQVEYNQANAAHVEARKAAKAAAEAAEKESKSEAGKFKAELAQQRNAYVAMVAELWKDIDAMRMNTVQVKDYVQLRERLDGQEAAHREKFASITGTLDGVLTNLEAGARETAELSARVVADKAQHQKRMNDLASRVEDLRSNTVEKSEHNHLVQDLQMHRKAHDASFASLWSSLESLRESVAEEQSQQQAMSAKMLHIESQRATYNDGIVELQNTLADKMEELQAGRSADLAEAAARGDALARSLEEDRNQRMEELQSVWEAMEGLRESLSGEQSSKDSLTARVESLQLSQDQSIQALQRSVEVLRAELDASKSQEALEAELSAQQAALSEMSARFEELRANLVELTGSSEKVLAEVGGQKESVAKVVEEIWESMEALKDSMVADAQRYDVLAEDLKAQRAAHDEGIEAFSKNFQQLKDQLLTELDPERFLSDISEQVNKQKAAQGEDRERIARDIQDLRQTLEQSTDRMSTEMEVQSIASKQKMGDLWKAVEALRTDVAEAFDDRSRVAESESDERAAWQASVAELWKSIEDLRRPLSEPAAETSGSDSVLAALDAHKDEHKSNLDALAKSAEELRVNVEEYTGSKAALEELEAQKGAHDRHIAHLSNVIETLKREVRGTPAGDEAEEAAAKVQ